MPTDNTDSPVFIVGCHRSGTNLLYDMLLSAGGFAIYRGILPVFGTLLPRFGSLENRSNRQGLLQTWLQSKDFRRSGVSADLLSSRILDECRSGGDFIRIVMESVAEKQGVTRWAVYNPDNVLHIERLKIDIPNSLFLHIIRDGRDIALSLKKMGGFTPLPWDRAETPSLVATALYWEWMVRNGRKAGQKLPADYAEVHYEDLILNPRETLHRVSSFLQQDLDYDRIVACGLGRISESNSSFRADTSAGNVSPLQRWKQRMSRENVAAIEAAVGECLEENGYSLSIPQAERRSNMRMSLQRTIYRKYFNTKRWLKKRTPAGQFVDLSVLEVEDAAE
jgi:hypothetical protein